MKFRLLFVFLLVSCVPQLKSNIDKPTYSSSGLLIYITNPIIEKKLPLKNLTMKIC